jgi:Rha family phage regulatory protein
MKEADIKADSLFLADYFERTHKNILRAIDDVIAAESGLSDEFVKRNFLQAFYVDSCGRKQRAYALTQNGVLLVAMGFTGREANKLKEMLIRALQFVNIDLFTAVSGRKKELYDFVQVRLED